MNGQSTSSSDRPSLPPGAREDRRWSQSPLRSPSQSSDFDLSGYLAVQPAAPHEAEASISTAVNVQPRSPVERSVKRRGSSRSSSSGSISSRMDKAAAATTLQVTNDEEDDYGWQHVVPQAGPSRHPDAIASAWHSHRRDASSASNADIGLRSIHSRHASSAAGSPMFLQANQARFQQQQHDRPHSTTSFNSETDIGGQFDDSAYLDDEAEGVSDNIPLSPLQNRRNWQQIRSGSAGPAGADAGFANRRLYDFPKPPDEDEPDQRRPEDIESSPETVKARKSRRARGTEAYYRRGNDGLSRSQTLVDNAKSGLKRMSMRVVNLRQRDDQRTTPARPQELGDEDEEEISHFAALQRMPAQPAGPEPDEPPEAAALRGRTLGIFGPTHWLRKLAHKVFLWPWTEPLVLLLIIVNVLVLTLQAAKDVYTHPRPIGRGYFHTWEDWVLFFLFIAFTIETMSRILVSGLVFGPEERPHARTLRGKAKLVWQRLTDRDELAIKRALAISNRGSRVALPDLPYGSMSTNASMTTLTNPDDPKELKSKSQREPSQISFIYPPPSAQPTLRSYKSSANLLTANSTLAGRSGFTSSKFHEDMPFVQASQVQQAQTLLHHKAFLRHSWNRVDALAVLSFWTMFCLAMSGVEAKHSVYVFRALSTVRAARLLTITAGTTTILRSLKVSAPMMVRVAVFVLFAMALFSLVGVQAFKGSFKRTCVWIDPAGVSNYTLSSQQCGGHLDPTTGSETSFIVGSTNSPSVLNPKGFICPLGQLCMETGNPENGVQSYDNILAALLQVVIITGGNGWADILYQIVDAENFAASLYFIAVVILLNYWLANIFVAIIVEMFSSIREESKHSAFSGTTNAEAAAATKAVDSQKKKPRRFSSSRLLSYTKWLWIGLIIADIGVQATKQANDGEAQRDLRNRFETFCTIAFLIEIVIRFLVSLPDWRAFWSSAGNITDVFLAIGTSVIQIPVIRNSTVYPWLTALQLARFYRVILVVPRMKSLLAKLLSSVAGLVNMVVFLLLMNFLAAVIAVQLLRGRVPEELDDDTVYWSFYQIYNAFLAVYIVFTSEGWIDIMFPAVISTGSQGWIAAIFLAGWFLLANFVLLQLFIALLNEGFAIAEEDKAKAQREAYEKRFLPAEKPVGWVRRWNPYRIRDQRRRKKAQAAGHGDASSPIALVSNPLAERFRSHASGHQQHDASFVGAIKRTVFKRDRHERGASAASRDVQSQLDLLKRREDGTLVQKDHQQRAQRAAEADFIRAHPSYDKSLFLFSNDNRLRQFCQTLVEPGHGERIFGIPHDPLRASVFKIIILCAIAASVAIAAISTPVYRREYYLKYGHIRLTWFNLTEASLGTIFFLEAVIRVIADGLIFSPNAMLLSVWGCLDFFVLVTIIVNVATSVTPNSSAVNTFTRTPCTTFYNVLIIGAGSILDAAVLTILYIIPYSVWGLNIFSGLMYGCNDDSVAGKTGCLNETSVTALDWTFDAPRVWQNPPNYSFDSFPKAFLILFEIVSLEGWSGVMQTAMSIVGRDEQPSQDAGQVNSIFFVIYNLLGAITVLTLFVSIILENASRRSGAALLTSEQREWLDMKKLLIRQRPSARPTERPPRGWRQRCYDIAITKHGAWNAVLTALYIAHIGILLSYTDNQPNWADSMRDGLFLLLSFIYAADLAIRFVGLGWNSFRQNGWHLFEVVVVVGILSCTVPLLLGSSDQLLTQLQKLFLVCIAFKLVEKNDSLNTLFKTAVASLSSIGAILLLWLVLFLVAAIMYVEVFSLTKWHDGLGWQRNFDSFPRALVMLSWMSNGEAWNDYMHYYMVSGPQCSPSDSYLFSDCGSRTYALLLFISWNVISMYIFCNVLVGVVVASFSYVYSLHGSKTLSRDEMRAFKKAWASCDTDRRGYLHRGNFIQFLASLDGIFNVRPYDTNHTVRHLRYSAKLDASKSQYGVSEKDDIDTSRLGSLLADLDVEEVKRRKQQLNRIYHECLLVEAVEGGVSFTAMLLILAQHRLIEPELSLTYADYMRRKAAEEQVDNLIGLDRVRGLLRTIYCRRAFLQYRATRQAAPVPAIVLQENADQDPAQKLQRRPNLRLDLNNSMSLEQPASAQTLLSPLNSPTWAEIGRRSLDGASPELDAARRLSTSSSGSAREVAAGLTGASLAVPSSPTVAH